MAEDQRSLWISFRGSRHDRLRDQLMTLWMQLVELDARVTRGASADMELPDKGALFRWISRVPAKR